MLELVLIQILTLALFGAALFFAFRSQSGKQQRQLRDTLRRAKRHGDQALKTTSELGKLVQQLDMRVRQQKGLPDFNLNPFNDMEKRYEKKLSTVVSVNGEDVQPS